MPLNPPQGERGGAYLAGYFDAAGCLHVGRDVQIVIGNHDRGRLDWLTVWGGAVRPASGRLGAEYFEWRLQRRQDVIDFLEEIRPYLVWKAEKADEALRQLRGAVRHVL